MSATRGASAFAKCAAEHPTLRFGWPPPNHKHAPGGGGPTAPPRPTLQPRAAAATTTGSSAGRAVPKGLTALCWKLDREARTFLLRLVSFVSVF